MQRLNPSFMDHLLAEDVIKKLETILPNIEGNFTAWKYSGKGLVRYSFPTKKRERNIKFIDTENIDRNTFRRNR